jgi:hypothetical protein
VSNFKNPCECSDPGCPEHKGKEHCNRAARTNLRRSDMDDETGTLMCAGCADDAMESGLFFEDRSAWIQATTKRR